MKIRVSNKAGAGYTRVREISTTILAYYSIFPLTSPAYYATIANMHELDVPSDVMTPTRWRKVWHCNQCGFDWLKRARIKPKRCASQSCRSVAWDQPKLKEKLKPGRKPKARR